MRRDSLDLYIQRYGPSKSFVDKNLYDIPCPSVDQSTLKQAALNIASQSIDQEECKAFLDMVGINIREVWP